MHGLNGVVKIGDLIPKTTADLKGWVIVSDGALRWIGKPPEAHGGETVGPVRLSPAYQATEVIVSNGQQIARPRSVVPIDYLPSAREVFVEARSIIRVDSLDDEDKAQVLAWIKGAEEMRQQMRAQRARIVIPTGVRPQ